MFFFFFVIHSSWTVTVTILGYIWVKCSDNKQPQGLLLQQYTTYEKMLKQNMTQRGTQATGFDVMIGRCSPVSQHGRHNPHPMNVGCYFFQYTNDELGNHTNQRHKHKTWATEDN